MQKLSDRIKYIRTKIGINQLELAEVLEASDGKVKGWEQGRTESIKPRDALIIQDKYGFSQDWIMYGTGDMMVDKTKMLLDNIQATVNMLDNTIQIPFYEDIQASAGYGCENDEALEPTTKITISKSMLPCSSKKIDAVKVSGTSMEQTIMDGDVVFVDRDDMTVMDGKIYVVYLCGECYVKRAFIEPKSKAVLLHSDNPLFPAINIDCEDFRIIGRVISNLHIQKL